jgi:hypothetical protein
MQGSERPVFGLAMAGLAVKKTTAAALLVSLGVVLPPLSQAVVGQAVRDACHDDYLTLYDGIVAPIPQMHGCNRAHTTQLSKPCLHALVDDGDVSKAGVTSFYAAKNSR